MKVILIHGSDRVGKTRFSKFLTEILYIKHNKVSTIESFANPLHHFLSQLYNTDTRGDDFKNKKITNNFKGRMILMMVADYMRKTFSDKIFANRVIREIINEKQREVLDYFIVDDFRYPVELETIKEPLNNNDIIYVRLYNENKKEKDINYELTKLVEWDYEINVEDSSDEYIHNLASVLANNLNNNN
jgi:hypothetical protein